MIYPELFRNTGSSLPDRRATPRQKYGTGWVLNLARKIDISSTPLLIFPGGGESKSAKIWPRSIFLPQSTSKHFDFETKQHVVWTLKRALAATMIGPCPPQFGACRFPSENKN